MTVFKGLIRMPESEHPPSRWKPGVNLALVASFHGRSLVLAWVGQHIEWEIECVGESGLAETLEAPEDGVWVWSGRYVDGGPESWEMPHIRDVYLDGEWRPATKEEWHSHCSEEWPWEPSIFDAGLQSSE